MRLVFAMLALGSLTACGGGAAECGEAECADICAEQAPAPAPTEAPAPAAAPAGAGDDGLTSFENDLVGPVLEDIREGVRPFTEDGIGICKGTKECEEYLGMDPGELPEGKYMVRAEVRVPQTGEKGTWKVHFETECTTVRKTGSGETTSSSNYSKTYEVVYTGEERGYRLQPLRTIQSPSTGGDRTCTWKITAPHPDGDKVYEGKWSVPDKG